MNGGFASLSNSKMEGVNKLRILVSDSSIFIGVNAANL